MKIHALCGTCFAITIVGCGGAQRHQAATSPSPSPSRSTTTSTTKAPPIPPPTGPVHERAGQLRRAADLLDQAQQAQALGNPDGAEILFSTAELITGPEPLAAIAPTFRDGAPPRVTTAPIQVPLDQAPQPQTVGNSDEDDAADASAAHQAPKPPERGSLSGTVRIAGAAGGGLALVTLEPAGTWKPRAPKVRVMEQRDRQFAPRLMLIPVGSTVQFPNFDDIFHNVFSTSAPGRFDLGLYRKGEAREVRFDQEGIVRIGCNIHANMGATIVVIRAPHYVIAGADGSFAFKSLAPGRYTLRAWSERSKAPITQAITIRAGANTAEVGVDGDAPAGVMPDKFGAPRGK